LLKSARTTQITKYQEFTNPLVCPYLHLYPEDSGIRLEEARQATKWKEEVDGNVSAPMARSMNGKDYYVEEPVMANLDSHGNIGPVMPMRWLMRDGNLWAVAHKLRITREQDAYVIDATSGGSLELPLTAFFLTVEELADSDCQKRYLLPPLKIAGI
jgi:hypothetical protein